MSKTEILVAGVVSVAVFILIVAYSQFAGLSDGAMGDLEIADGQSIAWYHPAGGYFYALPRRNLARIEQRGLSGSGAADLPSVQGERIADVELPECTPELRDGAELEALCIGPTGIFEVTDTLLFQRIERTFRVLVVDEVAPRSDLSALASALAGQADSLLAERGFGGLTVERGSWAEIEAATRQREGHLVAYTPPLILFLTQGLLTLEDWDYSPMGTYLKERPLVIRGSSSRVSLAEIERGVVAAVTATSGAGYVAQMLGLTNRRDELQVRLLGSVRNATLSVANGTSDFAFVPHHYIEVVPPSLATRLEEARAMRGVPGPMWFLRKDLSSQYPELEARLGAVLRAWAFGSGSEYWSRLRPVTAFDLSELERYRRSEWTLGD